MTIARFKRVGLNMYWRYESLEQYAEMYGKLGRFQGAGWYNRGNKVIALDVERLISNCLEDVKWAGKQLLEAEQLEQEMLRDGSLVK